MNKVFGDAFYFFALLNRNDEAHARAVEFAVNLNERLVTTEWVLTELADGLASSRRRQMFAQTRSELLVDDQVLIVPSEPTLYEQGVALYSARPDKEWSLTDCLSFVVMQREGITDALTADHHFEQAGFVALLK